MKPLWINRKGTISSGILKGYEGIVVAFDSTTNEAFIQLDDDTCVEVRSEMIDQD